MRVLVTGSSGFIGTRLVARLRELGDLVVGTSAAGSRKLRDGEIEANLLDADALHKVVEQVDPEVVIHLGGLSHVGMSWKQIGAYFRVNVLGTENLLRAATGRRVVFASSAEVYGKVPASEQPISEDRTPDPRSPYAMSKAAAERLCLERGAMVMRAFNIVGRGQSAEFVLPSFASQLADIQAGRQDSLRVGNLEAQRDFVHVEDAVDAFRLVAEQGKDSEIYNMGRGETTSIRQMLDLLLATSGVDVQPEIDPERFRPVDVPVLRANNTKLTDLGWKPERPIRLAVEEVWTESVERTRRENLETK